MHGFDHHYDLMLIRQRHADQRRNARVSHEFREARGRHPFRSRHRRKKISP